MLVTALGIVLWASTMLVAYTDRAYICENTGSRKGCREWFFGVKTNKWYHVSELEKFLQSEHSEVLRHRWTCYGGTGRSLIPYMTSRGHGRPGPILILPRETLDDYVQSLSGKQRLELYQFFSRADIDSIQGRVEMIFDDFYALP
jgi:hypothetical protein